MKFAFRFSVEYNLLTLNLTTGLDVPEKTAGLINILQKFIEGGVTLIYLNFLHYLVL